MKAPVTVTRSVPALERRRSGAGSAAGAMNARKGVRPSRSLEIGWPGCTKNGCSRRQLANRETVGECPKTSPILQPRAVGVVTSYVRSLDTSRVPRLGDPCGAQRAGRRQPHGAPMSRHRRPRPVDHHGGDHRVRGALRTRELASAGGQRTADSITSTAGRGRAERRDARVERRSRRAAPSRAPDRGDQHRRHASAAAPRTGCGTRRGHPDDLHVGPCATAGRNAR